MAVTVYCVVGGQVTLGLHLVKGGAGVAGQVPTVELRRLSDGLYFDWAALVDPFWLAAGGQREEVLAPATWLSGLYTKPWSHATYGDGAPEQYLAIYRNTTPAYLVQEIEQYAFTWEWSADVVEARKLLANKTVLRKITDNHFQQFYYDDAETAIERTDDITVVGADEIRVKV